MAHLLSAFVHHQEEQGEVSLSVSRQAFGGIQRQEEKNPQNQNKNSYTLPYRQGISGELPSSWGFSLPPLMQTGGQNLSGLFWKTHAQTYTRTHTLCPGEAFCRMSNFPSFSEQGSRWEKQFQKCWSLPRRVSYSNSLPGRWARVASQLAAKF